MDSVDSVGEDFFSVSKNLIIDERLKGNLFAFGELITIEEDILNDAKIIADKVVLSSSIYGSLITLNNSTYIKSSSFIEEDFIFIGATRNWSFLGRHKEILFL